MVSFAFYMKDLEFVIDTLYNNNDIVVSSELVLPIQIFSIHIENKKYKLNITFEDLNQKNGDKLTAKKPLAGVNFIKKDSCDESLIPEREIMFYESKFSIFKKCDLNIQEAEIEAFKHVCRKGELLHEYNERIYDYADFQLKEQGKRIELIYECGSQTVPLLGLGYSIGYSTTEDYYVGFRVGIWNYYDAENISRNVFESHNICSNWDSYATELNDYKQVNEGYIDYQDNYSNGKYKLWFSPNKKDVYYIEIITDDEILFPSILAQYVNDKYSSFEFTKNGDLSKIVIQEYDEIVDKDYYSEYFYDVDTGFMTNKSTYIEICDNWIVSENKYMIFEEQNNYSNTLIDYLINDIWPY